MTSSSQPLSVTAPSANVAAPRPSTLPHGLTSADGRTIPPTTQRQPIDPQDALDTLQALSTISQWVPQHDARERQRYLALLNNLLRPATYETALVPLGRMLQCFPGRKQETDAIWLASTAEDLEGWPLCSIEIVCTHLRQEATNDNPFQPLPGEVLKRVKVQTQAWLQREEEFRNPQPVSRQLAKPIHVPANPRAVPWADLSYHDVVAAGLLDQVIEHCKGLGQRAGDYCLLLHSTKGYPKNFMTAQTQMSAPDAPA